MYGILQILEPQRTDLQDFNLAPSPHLHHFSTFPSRGIQYHVRYFCNFELVK